MSLWRHRDFMRLWTGETISQLGTQVTLLALPLTAIYVLKASAFEMGVLSAVEMAPFLLVGLPAGVWVDRLRRRPVLIAGDLGRFVALGSVPLAYAFGVLTMAQLYLVAFSSGVLTVFFDVAYQSFLPSLVTRDDVVEGNSKLEISRSGAQLAGPGLAGVLVGAVNAPPAILVDAVSYLASAYFVFRIRIDEGDPGADNPRRGLRREIGEGVRYVLGHQYLRPIAMATGSSNLFGSMGVAILVLYMVRNLHFSAGRVGLVFTLANVGFLAGAFLASRIARRIGLGPAIIASIGVGDLGLLLVPAAPRSVAMPLIVAGQAIFGIGAVVYNINQVSLRQVITPEHLQGRMNATMRFLVWGTMPFGSFIGGALGGAIGLRPTLWVSAIGSCVAFVFPLLSPVRRLREMPEPADTTGATAAG